MRRVTLDAGEFVTTPDNDGNQVDGPSGGESASAHEPSESNSPRAGGTPPDARDQTAAYEGFGQMIAENVRRSSDLMLEMVAMRDSMAQALEGEGARERERLNADLADVEANLEAVRRQIDALAGQVGALRRSLSREPIQRSAPPAPASTTAGRPVPKEPSPSPEPAVSAPEPEPVRLEPAAAGPAHPWPAPQVIDVIVHHVHRATVALSLQRYLGALDSVAGVEAREFAEGVLRMQVTARQSLTSDDFDGWTDGGPFTMLQMQPTVIEMTLARRG